MPIECVCQTCGKTFSVPPSRIKAGGGKYCSMACLGKANAKSLKGNQYAKNSGGNSTSFKPGHKPWNKGLRGIHLSPDTEFKTGRRNDNRLPVGTVTVRTDKNGAPRRFIKLEPWPVPWTEFARVVWQQHNGSIPDDYVIHHIDRDSLNDDISNLQAMSRAEHLAEHRDEIAEDRQVHY